jgi:hypothetical protein
LCGFSEFDYLAQSVVAGPFMGCDQVVVDQHGMLLSQLAPALYPESWCYDAAFLKQVHLQQEPKQHGLSFHKQEKTMQDQMHAAQRRGTEKDHITMDDATKVKVDSLNDASTEDADSSSGARSTNEINSFRHDDSSDSDLSSDDSCSTTFEDCFDEDFFDATASQGSGIELFRDQPDTTTACKLSVQDSPVSDISARSQQRCVDTRDKNMLRIVRSILNKVTAESIDKLYAQIIACDFEESDFITILVDEVFEKATRQHNFIPLYVELCSRFHKTFLGRNGAENGKIFRRSLLGRCQQAFQEVLEEREDHINVPAEDREEAQTNRRIFVLGVFKFIGALLARGLLASCILPTVIDELLQVEETTPKPSSLEFLTVLLTTVGSKVDVPAWAYYQHFCECFGVLGKLQMNKQLPSRTRCLLSNVLDLRARGWQ